MNLLIPKDPNTSTRAPRAMIIVRSRPECKIDSNAKLRPKYIKNLKIHQYIRIRVYFRRDLNLKRSKKLYSLAFFFASMTPVTKNYKVLV